MTLSRKVGLKPGPPMKRSGKLAPRSTKMAARQQAKSACYGHVRAAIWCPCCGKSGFCTPSHVLPTGMNAKHEANAANVKPLCWPCHCLWENNKLAFRQQHPDMWAEKMAAMEEVDPQAFAKCKALHPEWFE